MKKPLTEEETLFHKKLNEQLREDKQKMKGARERLDKYVAKLNEREKAGDFSGNNLPYYLQKDWLIERARELLGLVMYKRVGPDPQLVIYPHEVAKLLKKTIRTAQNVLKNIRQNNNKAPRMPVTMKEFCEHFGFDIEDVKKELTQ
jgi:hypothetical protein